jgi:hypothetical protein
VKPSPKSEIVFTPEGKAKLVDGDLVALVPLHVAFELCKTDSGCKTNWPLGNGVGCGTYGAGFGCGTGIGTLYGKSTDSRGAGN